jgi:hypothetical protein
MLVKFETQRGATSIKGRDLDFNFQRLQPIGNGTYGINQSNNGWSLDIFPAYPATATQALYLAYTGGSMQWRPVENVAAGAITAGAISPGPNGSLFVTEAGAADWSDSLSGIVTGDGNTFSVATIGAGLSFDNNTLSVTLSAGSATGGGIPGTAISPGSLPATALAPGPNGSLFITADNTAQWSDAPPSGTPAWRQVERCDGKRMYVWGTEWAAPA